MATQTASSSSSSSRKYDVFLSFCGVDTRKNFTDHLYTALKQKGIVTFRDDEKLERGKYISEELLKAIEESVYAIIVLSKNYASSRWCLIELAKIVECTKKTGLIVFPVFYHVDPSDVRNQTGTLGEAFTKHEKDPKVNIDDIQVWKAALIKVGNTSGWHLHDGHESKVIEEMVGKILGELTSTYSNFHKDLVGINSRMEELVNFLGMGLSDVRFIGIWGMGGMGKTTLAQVVYDRFRDYFEGSSFLANVREESGKHGLVYLQKRLLFDILVEKSTDILDVQRGINVILKRLCHKKVLIILDDVDQRDQLEALVGEQSWFGQGSRIIITTRDQHLLFRHEVAEAQIYKVKELNDDESLKLFSQKAFNKKDQPPKGYVEMSQKFIDYAKGLPLALEVLGSFLCHRSLNLWESALAKFKENPPKDILDVLQISFDGLEEREKNIYLDIACFFNGNYEGYVTEMLQILYDKPDIDIDVLLKKSLVTISRGYFQMHDLLQELGRAIVHRESPEEAGKRSRLWHSEDVRHILKENTGTNSVKGIFLESRPEKERHLNVEAFPKMKNLRLLKISNVHLPQGLDYLSSELRSIHWAGYPLESLPTSFEAEKLVELIMGSSLIKQLWKGFKSCDELKHIDLSDSINLIEIPDLSGVPNLEQLILQGCTTLHRIHESLGNLKRLIQLDLKNCKCLERLPHKINLESLEIFNLSGCSKLIKFPKIVRNMSHLSKLYLCEIAIKALPLPLEHLTSLTELNLSDCKDLDELPKNLGNMKGLEKLDVSRTAIKELPSSIIQLSNLKGLLLCGCMSLQSLPELPLNLRELDVSGSAITGLPLSIEHLIGLTKLDLRDCKNLSSLPNGCYSSMSLKVLNLSGCSKLDELPKNLGKIEGLDELDLSGTAITGLPSSVVHSKNLKVLSLSGCVGLSSRRSPDPMGMLVRSLIGSCSLTELDLGYCNIQTIPNVLGCLSSLESLYLWGNNFVCLPESIIQLSNLKCLWLCNCPHLQMLPELPSKIVFIDARDCTSLETLSLRPEDNFRPNFLLLNCNKLSKNQGYGDLVSTMLRRYILNPQGHREYLHYDVRIPGSEIPKMFSHQNVGGSVNLQVPSDLLGNKLMGIAVCAVFVFRKNCPPCYFYFWCSIGRFARSAYTYSEKCFKIGLYHLWLRYFPSTYFQAEWKEILNEVDANGFSQIEVKFEPECPGLEVTKCGAHMVSERDIEDLINQTKAGPSSCIITPYDEDGFEDSEKDTKIKRSRDESDGEGAGPSGEATSNDEPPHLNLIENWFRNPEF